MRLFNFLADQPWAITLGYAQRMVEIYNVALDRKSRGEEFDRKALEKEIGKPLDNTRTVTTREGVATIPVEGPLFRRADMFTEISGATTHDTLAKDFTKALEDPTVKAIILYIDSPGGEVNGTNEFADMVYGARNQKPIIAYVSGLGASAAYWIASAASEVVIDATAPVGSIGVVAAVRDPSKENRKDIEFVSSQSPKKRPDPLTEAGKATIQTFVDDLAQVFVDSVARNRNVSSETVVKEFGAGGLLVGQKAVDAGLADRIGSYESVLTELATGGKPKQQPSKNVKASLSDNGAKPMADKSWIQKIFGGLSAEERAEAKAALGETENSTAPAPVTQPTGDSEEVKALRARAAQAERYEATIKQARDESAKKFARDQVAAHTILPASLAKVETMFRALAEAEDNLSLTGDAALTAQITAIFAELPKHSLTTELMPADLPPGAVALNPDAGTEAEVNKKAEADARAWAEKQNPRPHLQGVK